METLKIALAIGSLVFIALVTALYALSQRRVNLQGRLKGEDPEKATKAKLTSEVARRIGQAIRPLGEMLPRSPEEMTRKEKKLAQAGIRRKDAAILFYSAQVVSALALLFIFSATGYLYKNFLICIALSIIGGMAIPDIWVRNRVERRKLKIQHALPDAMDLSVVCVEAGLGLDQALLRVANEIHISAPELAEEFNLRNIEINMGRSRADALRNLAERTGVDDLKALVAILIQTDRFGTSVGTALRTFSDSLRIKRRQRAEEMAAKLSVKMLFPMMLFIFPAIFFVILGPAVIAIARNLLPTLAGR